MEKNKGEMRTPVLKRGRTWGLTVNVRNSCISNRAGNIFSGAIEIGNFDDFVCASVDVSVRYTYAFSYSVLRTANVPIWWADIGVVQVSLMTIV